jgi:hypothetical protein
VNVLLIWGCASTLWDLHSEASPTFPPASCLFFTDFGVLLPVCGLEFSKYPNLHSVSHSSFGSFPRAGRNASFPPLFSDFIVRGHLSQTNVLLFLKTFKLENVLSNIMDI